MKKLSKKLDNLKAESIEIYNKNNSKIDDSGVYLSQLMQIIEIISQNVIRKNHIELKDQVQKYLDDFTKNI